MLRSPQLRLNWYGQFYFENPGPGKDTHGELEPRPGIGEQPGSRTPV